MNNIGTFCNEIRQNAARNQNQILTEKNVCTEFLTKLSDSEKFRMDRKNGNVRECPDISVLHQNVDVPTKSYCEMNNSKTFPMNLAGNLRKNKNNIFDAENVYTKSFTKLIDFWKILM